MPSFPCVESRNLVVLISFRHFKRRKMGRAKLKFFWNLILFAISLVLLCWLLWVGWFR